MNKLELIESAIAMDGSLDDAAEKVARGVLELWRVEDIKTLLKNLESQDKPKLPPEVIKPTMGKIVTETVPAELFKVTAKLVEIGQVKPSYDVRREWRPLVFEDENLKLIEVSANRFATDELELVGDPGSEQFVVVRDGDMRLEKDRVYSIAYYQCIDGKTHIVSREGEVIPHTITHNRLNAYTESGGTAFMETHAASVAALRAKNAAILHHEDIERVKENVDEKIDIVEKVTQKLGESVVSSNSFADILDYVTKV